MKTPDDKKKFLEMIEKGVSITKACQMIGIHRSTFYEWKDTDMEFLRNFISSKSICFEETNDAAAYHYHRLVREGDKRYLNKWLDDKHPDFAKKTVTLLIERAGKADAAVGQFSEEELFTSMNAFENNGFKVTGMLDQKTLEKYLAWKETKGQNPIPPNEQVIRHILKNLGDEEEDEDED